MLSSHSRRLLTPPPPPHRRSSPHRPLAVAPPPSSLARSSLVSGKRSTMAASPISASPTPIPPPPAAARWEAEVDEYVAVANKVADAAGEVIRKYFRQTFEILDKDDLSPVTIADRESEESMVSIIMEEFPSHAVFGEENGWRYKGSSADYVWVLDPIDGTKSFITGKPLFGTLIALLYKGKPIIGIVDQPVLRERWVGISGMRTTLNGQEISTRACTKLSQAYLYTTSPHFFKGDAEEAFIRIRNKVKVPLYGCDCYAYALLASGFVDLVIESGLKPYDFLSLVPVIEGAGGIITDWKGNKLDWEASADVSVASFNVAAAGDPQLHQLALDALQWQ